MAEQASTAAVEGRDGPDVEHIQNDIDNIIASARPIAEKTGQHRAAIKQLLEERGYEKGAFAQLVKIGKMSEEKRADFLATLIPGLQRMLPVWQEGETADLFGLPQDDPGNVTQLMPAAPAAAE